MASLKDVAQLAGVSMMTVSRVINNAPRVTAATRQRVEEAIEQLHYVPDFSAQKIRGKPTNLERLLSWQKILPPRPSLSTCY